MISQATDLPVNADLENGYADDPKQAASILRDAAEAGDIVAVAGFKNATVADTICDQAVEWALPGQPVDPPTLAMTFSVNDSPLAGREGDKVTTRMIRARLMR